MVWHSSPEVDRLAECSPPTDGSFDALIGSPLKSKSSGTLLGVALPDLPGAVEGPKRMEASNPLGAGCWINGWTRRNQRTIGTVLDGATDGDELGEKDAALGTVDGSTDGVDDGTDDSVTLGAVEGSTEEPIGLAVGCVVLGLEDGRIDGILLYEEKVSRVSRGLVE